MKLDPNLSRDGSPWVLCLDLQRDLAPQRATAERRRQIATCQRFLGLARAAGWPLVHSLHRSCDPAVTPAPIGGLEPRPFEPVFVRPGLSAFSHRRLNEFAEAERGGELILVAVTIGPACLATAFDAHDRGLRVVLAEDTLAACAFGPFASATVRGVLLSAAGPFVRRTTTLELLQKAARTGQPAAANDIIGETDFHERL